MFHSPFFHPFRSVSLNYKTFYPLQIQRGGSFNVPEFESMSQTVERARVWINSVERHLEVISVETVAIRMFTGNQHGCAEQTYSWNRSERGRFYLLLRFLDVCYIEIILEGYLILWSVCSSLCVIDIFLN